MNKKLRKIFQEDRIESLEANQESDWGVIDANRKERRRQINKMISEGELRVGADFYHAALIFQHSDSVSHIRKAKSFAKKAMGMGNDSARWMYAAATDRILMYEKVAQKYGTQMVRNKKTGLFELYKYLKKTTDEGRERYNVPPLSVAIERIEKMNRGEDWWR